MHDSIFFSQPQRTLDAAHALHEYDLFNPAAVFETPDGFVYGRIREMECPPHTTAQTILDLMGWRMVSYHGPLLNVWRTYET